MMGIVEVKDENIWVGGRNGYWRYYGVDKTYFTGSQTRDSAISGNNNINRLSFLQTL